MFASLADLKAHLTIPSGYTTDDAELQLTLDAAEEVVEGLVGDFASAAFSDSLPVTSGTVLLPSRPSGSVLVADSDGQGVTGFTVRADARLLVGVSATGYVTVTYPTGSDVVPASVRLATCIIAGHLWETQRGNGPGPLDLQGEQVPVGTFGAGFAVPARARELLARYILSGQIA